MIIWAIILWLINNGLAYFVYNYILHNLIPSLPQVSYLTILFVGVFLALLRGDLWAALLSKSLEDDEEYYG